MTVQEIIDRREIREVLHFTTNEGLVGMLDTNTIKSRQRLSQDQRLEFILRLNTPLVKDPGWEDHINFSLTRINLRLYNISANNWHTDAWWRILAFDPVILTHDAVVFSTTNNCYPSVIRGQGADGLEALFAPTVEGLYQEKIGRGPADLPSLPTCEQAEVLYPEELSTSFLRKIYVPSGEAKDNICGQIAVLGHANIEVIENPDKFRGKID